MAPAATSHHTGYPGDLKFPGRCDRFYTIFLFHLATKIWQLVCQLADVFVCDQDGGPPRLPVTCFGELERRQTAQQAELGGVGGVVFQFYQNQNCDFKHLHI